MAMLLRVYSNPNCVDLEPTELREVSPPVELGRIRVRWKDMPPGSEVLTEELIWADIWGWSSRDDGSVTPAYAQRVIDPEGDEGIVVYGGDWGVKVRVKSEEVGRNILWVPLDQARDSLPAEVFDQLGLNPP
jgi:hypothetical protein